MTLGKHVKESLKSEYILYVWISELLRALILEYNGLSGEARPLI